jgi:hypothetical protein
VVCKKNNYHFLIYSLIFFVVEGGVGSNDVWPPSVGNSWRTTNDIQDNWASMISNINHVEFIL